MLWGEIGVVLFLYSNPKWHQVECEYIAEYGEASVEPEEHPIQDQAKQHVLVADVEGQIGRLDPEFLRVILVLFPLQAHALPSCVVLVIIACDLSRLSLERTARRVSTPALDTRLIRTQQHSLVVQSTEFPLASRRRRTVSRQALTRTRHNVQASIQRTLPILISKVP